MPPRPFLLAAFLLLVLSGCATRPVEWADSRPVAPKRLLADYAFYDHPVHHGAKLVVIRDAGRFDEPETAQVIVDGRAIAYLRSKERLEVYVYAGERILSVGAKPGFLAAPLINHTFAFQADRTYLVRVGIRGGQFDIGPATQVLSAQINPGRMGGFPDLLSCILYSAHCKYCPETSASRTDRARIRS